MPMMSNQSNQRAAKSMIMLHRQIVDALLVHETPDSGGRNAPASEAESLRQLFYISMISAECRECKWSDALGLVTEAFAHTPISLHKPLWKWRVMVC